MKEMSFAKLSSWRKRFVGNGTTVIGGSSNGGGNNSKHLDFPLKIASKSEFARR
jgi:hypothetical protein